MTEAPAAGTTATAGELQIGDRVTCPCSPQSENTASLKTTSAS